MSAPEGGPPRLALLVLRARDLACTARFYEALGLALTAEQHGRGPAHVAPALGDLVLEIYPGESATRDDATGLALRVPSVRAALERLAALGIEAAACPPGSDADGSVWVRDPDGRIVWLLDASPG